MDEALRYAYASTQLAYLIGGFVNDESPLGNAMADQLRPAFEEALIQFSRAIDVQFPDPEDALNACRVYLTENVVDLERWLEEVDHRA